MRPISPHQATSKKRKNTGESSVLQQIQKFTDGAGPARMRTAGVLVGIGDDAAIWRPRSGYETVLTTDWFLEGTHFLPGRHTPAMIAHKCLARAVSDVAAMGGEPRCFLLSLALPGSARENWLSKFMVALCKTSRRLGCPLIGGDTTLRNQILINITVVGECKRGQAILRSGARPGDSIFVTGTLGKAAYGLRTIQKSRGAITPKPALRKHLFPEPRLLAGLWLGKNRLATAMIDLSDGLSSDLPRICAASGVGARIEETRLAKPTITAHARFDATDLALHGGDDYELLFTVAKKNISRIPRAIARIPITRIGEITSGNKILLVDNTGGEKELGNQGWDPFR
jgi:thiamine-monophosphate kinase